MYALSVGVELKTGNQEDNLIAMSLLYENSEGFAPLSSCIRGYRSCKLYRRVIPAFGGLALLVSGEVPGLSINLANVLHGEQYTEILNPIPTGTSGSFVFYIDNIIILNVIFLK